MRIEKDLTNTDVGMPWTFWVSTYPGLTSPILDAPADPIREYLPEAAR